MYECINMEEVYKLLDRIQRDIETLIEREAYTNEEKELYRQFDAAQKELDKDRELSACKEIISRYMGEKKLYPIMNEKEMMEKGKYITVSEV